ncbi:DNA end-binding protein Ku, partial [Bradyrhizobium sp. NFR13]
EVRSEDEYFDDIQDVKVTKDMLDLAQHIVQQKTAEFDPSKFDDRYESALVDLINQKRAGATIKPHGKARPGTNVVDLMTALKQSLAGGTAAPKAKAKKPGKRAAGQKEMLLPIGGTRAAAKTEPKAKPSRLSAKARKAS